VNFSSKQRLAIGPLAALLNWELRQQQALYVAPRVANEKARFANIAARVAALRLPKATISQQHSAAGVVLRATRNLINNRTRNELPNVLYEKKDISA
jgi:hypothetical protein